MILSNRQLIAVVRFADNAPDDVLISYSFRSDEDMVDETINVGRQSDQSMVRVAYDGTTYLVNTGTRSHLTADQERCWCGEFHPLAHKLVGAFRDGE